MEFDRARLRVSLSKATAKWFSDVEKRNGLLAGTLVGQALDAYATEHSKAKDGLPKSVIHRQVKRQTIRVLEEIFFPSRLEAMILHMNRSQIPKTDMLRVVRLYREDAERVFERKDFVRMCDVWAQAIRDNNQVEELRSRTYTAAFREAMFQRARRHERESRAHVGARK